jgi:hypothetical protein
VRTSKDSLGNNFYVYETYTKKFQCLGVSRHPHPSPKHPHTQQIRLTMTSTYVKLKTKKKSKKIGGQPTPPPPQHPYTQQIRLAMIFAYVKLKTKKSKTKLWGRGSCHHHPLIPDKGLGWGYSFHSCSLILCFISHTFCTVYLKFHPVTS